MKKKKILIISSIVFVIIVTTLFVSYGFITTIISGNETSKKAVFNGQIIKVEYSDGTETLTSNQGVFTPGSTITKTFTVKNTGNASVKYSINLDNITNTFTRKNDITYELSNNDTILKNGIYDTKGIFPDSKATILNKDVLGVGESKTYTLKINYLNSEENQIIDSGSSLSAKILIEESKNSLEKLVVFGNSIQNGIPTIETPVEIKNLGEYDETIGKYKITVKVSGKNLYKINDISADGPAIQEIDCYLDRTFTISAVEENLSLTAPIWRVRFTYLDGKYEYLTDEGYAYVHFPATKKPTPDNPIVKITTRNNGILSGRYKNIQIEYGSTVTDYEPYYESVTTNIYLDEPLRKIGDYADYIDFEKEKVFRNVEVLDDTGTLSLRESYRGVIDNIGTNIELSNILSNNKNNIIEVCSNNGVCASNIEVEYDE